MTPDLMEAGVEKRQALAARQASSTSGGRETSYGRVVQPGALDTAHGAILYLDDITVSFDGFKALNALSLSISAGELRCIETGENHDEEYRVVWPDRSVHWLEGVGMAVQGRDGAPATLQRIVREGDAIEVHPWSAGEMGSDPIFVADAHLGGLARFLRMLGFDTLWRNDFADDELALRFRFEQLDLRFRIA